MMHGLAPPKLPPLAVCVSSSAADLTSITDMVEERIALSWICVVSSTAQQALQPFSLARGETQTRREAMARVDGLLGHTPRRVGAVGDTTAATDAQTVDRSIAGKK